ncbi:MAG: S9 family peptidase [Beijerinckiaceae bacterium]|jgi:oligopeptidase B
MAAVPTPPAFGLAVPPRAVERRPVVRSFHGHVIEDDYAWLRAENWQGVLRDPAALPQDIRGVLEAENAYSAAILRPLEGLSRELAAEMRGRIKEDDSTVPLADGPWLYYKRYREGGEQPLFCRKPGADGAETVLLDGDREREGHPFFSIGEAVHAPNHALLGWSADIKGSELHTIRVRDLASGADLSDRVEQTEGGLVWLNDSSGFYYVRVDDNHRTAQVFRHRIGDSEDKLVFEELDPAWFVGIERSQSGAFAIVRVSDHNASECHLLDLDDPQAQPRCIEPRALDLRYSVEHRGTRLYILSNADGAEDFKIVSTPLDAPGRANWRDEVAHRQGRIIVAHTVYPDYLVRLERENGLPSIVIRPFASGEDSTVAFDEEAYSLSFEGRYEFDAPALRFTYASPTTPRETYDYHLQTHMRVLRKRQEIPSGHDPARYVTHRLYATAPDGESVPVTVLHRAGLALDGRAPLLLYGYGAYGHPLAASFSANVLSLVDRGFVYALAHVRGGTDKGWHWYLDGKLTKKPNTFSDFIAAAHHLIAQAYTSRGRIVAHGGSAGGMLMGAVANLAPELFSGIIANVPFVDVLNTMLDAGLPLTPAEWLEWGNPIEDAAAFEAIASYSPYDNVRPQTYPPIFALAGLTDPRVTYWEPAKWVARLRATMTSDGPVLLKTNMGAGHGGSSGRFDRLAEIAEEYAFALACAAASAS